MAENEGGRRVSLGSGDVPDAQFKTAGERRRRGKKEEKVTGNGQIACFIINVGLMASFCHPSMTVMWLWSHFGH